MNDMRSLRATILAALLVASAAACNTNTSGGNVLTGQVYLQLAVGTLNDSAGTLSGILGGPGAGTYLNAVSSFRNNLGASAFISPGNGFLHVPGAPAVAVGGLYSYGQGPGTNGVLGMPPAYLPPSTVGGYATGFIYTAAPPTPGQYALTTIANQNGINAQFGALATLPASPLVLPAYGSVPTYTPNPGTGGGTFSLSPPAGVTETLIVICSAACDGTNQVASVVAHGAGVVVPAGSIQPGTYSIFAIGADFPLVESGPPANAATTPTIKGAAGTADMTVSGVGAMTQT